MADTDTIAATLLSDLKRDFGLTNEQAAGVVGNLMHESAGFNTLQEISPVVQGSRGGFGYAQWTGDRRKAFDSYVKSAGLDPNSYEANYGFLRHEIQTNPYERKQFMTVKKADTAAEAARLVSENYLRPGVPRNASRVRLAEEALAYADMPIPPGELPGVGTALDTARTAPTPAIPSIAAARLRDVTSPTGGNSELQAYVNAEAAKKAAALAPVTVQARLPDISAPSRLQAIPQSIIERAPARPAASQSLLQALGSGSALARLNGEIPPPPAKEVNLAFDPGAVKAQVNSIPLDTALAALLAERVATPAPPITSISDRVRGNEAQTRNVATTIASFPTNSAPMLASLGGPARLPDIAPSSVAQSPARRIDYGQGPSGVGIMPSMQGMERLVAGDNANAFRGEFGVDARSIPSIAASVPSSGVGAPPTTRVVPTQPVVRQNTNIATARAEQAAQRQPVTSLPSITAATSSPARSAPPQSIIERSPAQSYPNQVRSIADMETTQRSPSNRVDAQPTWAELNTAMAPARSTPIALGNVMTPQAPRIDSIGSGASWSDLTGTMAPKSIAQPSAPAKAEDRLQSITALSFNPQPASVLPTKPQLEAATGFRTVTQDKRITNPEWTAYRAANPAQATRVGSPVPLGEMTYTGSRDAKAAAQAGQNFAATQMPAQFITVKEQVRVPVAAPKPAAVASPIIVQPQLSAAAPTPVSPFAPMVTAQHPILGILGAITGNRGPNTLLSSIIGAASSRPPLGASLGMAGNGGTVTQGYNGPMNSITQASDAWKKSTGQEDRYTRTGDGSFESASGGTYYDRHIN